MSVSVSVSDLRAILETGSPITLAGLGDSLTQGWLVKKGFFDRFCDRLSEKFSRAKIHRINAGIPGDTAAGGLYRLDWLIAQSPGWVVVQFALNDCYSGIDVSEFEQNIESRPPDIPPGLFVRLSPTLSAPDHRSGECEAGSWCRFHIEIQAQA